MKPEKDKLFSVKIQDCEVQTFRAGGPGGQNQNKRDTGVRIIHVPSGAVAESRSERTQLENKRRAFTKLGGDDRFLRWCRVVALQIKPAEEIVEEMMDPKNLKFEVKEKGKWVESNTLNS